MTGENTAKWHWKMEWLKKQRLPPANPYFWQKAEQAYYLIHPKESPSDAQNDSN